MRGLWIVALLMGTAAGQADCDHFKWSLAQEKAWFAEAEPVDAGAQIAPGHAYEVALKPEDKAEFVEPPKKQTPGAYGGVLKIVRIDKAGLYQITLSREAWVDVLQGGAKTRTKNVSRQRDCATFVKSVRFDLAAGPLTLEFSAVAAPSLTFALAPAP